jgi:hypothetical protein
VALKTSSAERLSASKEALCGGGVSNADLWQHVTVEFIECLLLSGVS